MAVNVSWGAASLYTVVLVPIDEVSPLAWAIASVWLAVNLVTTVHMRAALERRETGGSGGQSERGRAHGRGSLYAGAWRRLRKNRLATFCLGMLVLIGVLCFAHRLVYEVGSRAGASGELFTTHFDHTHTDKDRSYESPSRRHWFGTDALGRDLFARTMFGGSVSFLVAIVGTLVSLVVGVAWGSFAGYHGGRVDHYMMRVVDVLYGLPFLFLVILIMTLVNGLHATAIDARPHLERVSALEAQGAVDDARRYAEENGVDFDMRAAVFLDENVPPIVVMFIALGLVQWLTMARIVRGQVMALRERDFVVAARLAGATTGRIIARHLLPNLVGPVIVYATLTVPAVMLMEAFLSFLGLGISEPDCSWGSLAADGIGAINVVEPYWWLLAYPSAAISVALFSLNFAGDGLRDALDPRDRR